MSSTAAPIFVVGSSRSGTTLISNCLRCHPSIHITNETHYFDDLRPRLVRDTGAGDLDEAITYFRRLDANLYAMQGHPDDSPLDVDTFRERAAAFGNDSDACFEAFCKIQAERHGKPRWGEKTPRHVYQLDVILKRFPDAKVVFMVRDPRAVAASYRHWKYEGRAATNDPELVDAERSRASRSYHPLIMAFMWRSGADSGIRTQQKHGNDRVLHLRYEDLVAAPRDTLQRLCAFLDEPFDEAMLNVAAGNSSFAEFDRQGGINTASLDRWREKLSPADIASIQRCCRRQMDCFGYLPEPVGARLTGTALNWMTLPFAVTRALLANRTRIGHMPSYLWRRVRGVPVRT